MENSRIKWLSDLDKTVLMCNFEKRGWINGSVDGRLHILQNLLQLFLFMQMVTGISTGKLAYRQSLRDVQNNNGDSECRDMRVCVCECLCACAAC